MVRFNYPNKNKILTFAGNFEGNFGCNNVTNPVNKGSEDKLAVKDLTIGSVKKTMVIFALPYLLSCFLQTFYGLADMYVVGLYNGAEVTTAVAIGSQVMHLLTVMIVGLAMGVTVELGRSIGAHDYKKAARAVDTSVFFFVGLSIILMTVMIFLSRPLTKLMMTPVEALGDTRVYLIICAGGLPFIVAYNLISSIYRGIGDSRSPLIFIAIACTVNIILDFLFVGYFDLGANGAALATVTAQAISVVFSLVMLKRKGLGFESSKDNSRFHSGSFKSIIGVGLPVALQDGFIQVAFIVITIIANSRGLIVSTSVGVVEKIICFLFLVPSAFLSAISAITAQNMGAGKKERARESLRFGLLITVSWGMLCFIICQIIPGTLVGIFRSEAEIIEAGSQYLRAYSIDCVMAALHFCFSGYFCGDQKSGVSFLHNLISVIFFRIPGTYLAVKMFPDTLYPMGLAAPVGSFVSFLICVGFYVYYIRKEKASS